MLTLKTQNPSNLKEEILPFRVIVATTAEELQLAADTRRLSYGKHMPDFAEKLAFPDADDASPDFTSLLAISKLDGSCLGTVRVQIVDSSSGQLKLEESFALPSALKLGMLAEISRLAIPSNSNSLSVRLMLIKAAYWYCRLNRVTTAFLCARNPVDKQYRRFDLNDLTHGGKYVSMRHIGGVPHRIFWFNVCEIESQWLEKSNPLYELYVMRNHSDLMNDIQKKVLVIEDEKVTTKYA